MKILLALFLAFASLSASAQSTAVAVSDVPFKKANTVIIVTSDSAGAALRKLGAILVEKGYDIKKFDTDFNTIVTEPKSVKGSAWSAVIAVRGRSIPAGISLSAEITADMRIIAPGTEHTVARVSSSGKEAKGFFLWLDEIARAYPGAKVQYSQD